MYSSGCMIVTTLLVVVMFGDSVSTISPRTSDVELELEDSLVEQNSGIEFALGLQREREDSLVEEDNVDEYAQSLKRESEDDGLEYAQRMKRESEDRSELVSGVELVQGRTPRLGPPSVIGEDDGLEYLQGLKQDWDDRLDKELDRIAKVARYRNTLETFQICLGSTIVLLAIYIFYILN